jgi:hypothetical protein
MLMLGHGTNVINVHRLIAQFFVDGSVNNVSVTGPAKVTGTVFAGGLHWLGRNHFGSYLIFEPLQKVLGFSGRTSNSSSATVSGHRTSMQGAEPEPFVEFIQSMHCRGNLAFG